MKSMFPRFRPLLALLSCFTTSASERMEWWLDARFGMFIHWGPDAIPSLHWNGEPWNEGPAILYPAHESILHIPREEWRKEVIGKFNPMDYDAESWVKLAKRVGMRFQNDGVLVSLPGQPAHEAATVLVLEVESAPSEPSPHSN